MIAARPDGAGVHWEERGAGPAVVIAMHWAGHPRMFEPLAQELAREHRVLTYHPRGTGSSSREGPFDMRTDCADLIAVLEAAGAQGAVAIAIADAANRIVHAAVARPDLIQAAVVSSGIPLAGALQDTHEALAGSPSVRGAIVGLMETSYRAALRTLMESTNPELGEADVHRRVDEVAAFCEPQAAIGRLRAWIDDVADDDTRALGDRLWWLTTGDTNPWFPADLDELLPALLPEAHIVPVEQGPVNRPDITAEVVRRVTLSGGGRAG